MRWIVERPKYSTWQFKSLVPLCTHEVPVNYFEVVAPDIYQAQNRLASALKLKWKDLQCIGCHLDQIVPVVPIKARERKRPVKEEGQPVIF